MLAPNPVPYARGCFFPDDGGVFYLDLFGRISLFDWVGDTHTAQVLARFWNRKMQ